MEAFVPGIYPRSEALVQATRDLDRGRTTPEAVDRQVEDDLRELVRVQQEAGLDLLADGMLRWQDLFRPLLEASEGLRPGALTRFLDTNTFYRAPEANGVSPSLAAPLDERYVSPVPRPRLVTLPSPYALSLGTGEEPKAFAEGVLKPQIDALEADLVVLAEPFLAHSEEPDLDGLSAALETLGGGARLVLQCTFSDASTLLGRGLLELPVDGIGIDFYATRLTDVPAEVGKLLLAGVVDARSSVVEDAREIASFAAELQNRASELALVPNGDLQYVSEPIAREKIARLGQAKAASVEEAA
jgi:5-methyltetrahydropteroyltriglutamate--homocysteine methyltransferase